MKNYLLKCVALLLAGSLVIACGKDDDDDELIEEEKTEETSEGTPSSSSEKTDEGEKGEENDSTTTSTPPTTPPSTSDPSLTSTAEPEEIVEVKINATTFPDPKFRALISSRDYDKNGDGKLDKQEIIYIRNIYCQNMGIKSLKGIEYLKELRGIYCMDNQISDWDLSHNKLLTGIWCSGNKFTKLDFTGLDDLVWVYCHDNEELTTLNVKNNPKMAYIECNTTPLKELDVTHNPELEHLMCGTCGLTKLDLSHNPKLQHLDCFQNKFTSLDLSHNPLLKRLDIWNNERLGNVNINNLKGLQTYNCAKTGIKKLDVSHHPELYKLICSYNSITSLDLSKNPQLRFLWAAHNKFTSLDLSSNPYLIKVYHEGTYEKDEKYKIDHEWYIDLGGDVSTGDDNKLYLWVNIGVKINDVSNGTPAAQEKYSPLDPGVKESDCLTRGYVMNYLYEMAGKPNVSKYKSSFKDVAGTKYEAAIVWGELRAMTMGFPEFLGDYFNPNKWITRQDLTFMLMRYSEAFNLKREIDFGRSDEYLDYYDIDPDHWEAICWCATWHIIEGKGGSVKSQQKFDPYGRVTMSDLKQAIANLKEVNYR